MHLANWQGATPDRQKRALRAATTLLDQYIDWKGTVADNDQNLAWPRQGVYHRDRPEVEFGEEEIPAFLKVATLEYANDLLAEDVTADQPTGLASLRVGSIALNFNPTDRKDPVPESVTNIVKDYGEVRGTRGTRMVKVARR